MSKEQKDINNSDVGTVDPLQSEALDRVQRFDYLLKRSKFFSKYLQLSHNLGSSGGSSPTVDVKKNTSKPNHKSEHKSSTAKADDDELEHSTNEVYFEVTPHYIKGGDLRSYQLRGLNWMISLMHNGINGILADEMGLGKTLQTISLLGYLKHFCNHSGPSIVIVPKSTLQNWLNEFKRWCPSLKVICLAGDKRQRRKIIADELMGARWDVCVTTYEICMIEASKFRKFNWHFLIIDEGHRIKNEQTKLAKILRGYTSKNRLLLTGTPLQNNLHELWALLNFLLPDVFNSSDDFDTWFGEDRISEGDSDELVTRLHTILQPFMLRRIKSEVAKELLPKKEIKIYVGMSKMQREWYAKVLLKDIDIRTPKGTIEKMKISTILMHLRKVCNHPYLFDGAEEEPCYNPHLTHLVENCGKMVILDKLLARLKANGSRVLIFSEMTRVLDILEDYCRWRDYTYNRLDGSTPHEKRATLIDEFNAEGSPAFLFMLSTRAGGLGINLSTADTVILYDSAWNPQVDLQAIDRAHRIGQKKQVRVFRLITEDTVEEKIVERGEIKMRLDRLVIQNGLVQQQQQQQRTSSPSAEEMVAIAYFGAKKMLASAESTIDRTTDIDTILQRCEIRTRVDQTKLDELAAQGESALQKFTLDTDTKTDDQPHLDSIYYFEGEDWLAKQKLLQEERENSDLNLRQSERKLTNSVTQAWVPLDHQFFAPELYQLLEKEYLFRCKAANLTVLSEHRQRLINEAQPLSAKEERNKKKYLEEGFLDWSRKDFNNFVRGLEQFEPDDLPSIAACVPTKTLEDVASYSSVFWRRHTELKRFATRMRQIKANQATRLRNAQLNQYLANKINKCENAVDQLYIQYPPNEVSTTYTVADDRFLICNWYDLGLDTNCLYSALRERILKSRVTSKALKAVPSVVLRERCDYLLSLIETEMREKGDEKSRKRGRSSDAEDKENEQAVADKKRRLIGILQKYY